ncbi:MAG TPA: extracellular solute-binding protein [Myxococcales bacterium]|jgi:ABC-type sugar transport system permease subunit/maltose-binding protein MalE
MAMLAGLLASASASASAAPVELVLWHSYTGAERETLDEIVKGYNAAHADVRVTALVIPYDAFADKLTSAMGVGKGPDAFIYPGQDRLGDWAAQGLAEPLQHALDGEVVRRFTPSALQALTVPQGGRVLYGLPIAMKSLALVYDGAKVPQAPKTLEELTETAKKLTGDGSYGFVMDWASAYTEAGFLHAFGGKFLDEKGQPALNAAHNAEALAWVKGLRDQGLLPREVTGAMVSSLFNDHKAAMIVAGPWFLGDIKPGIDVRVAPLPSGPAGPVRPYLGVEAVILSAKSAHKKEALAFALALTSDDAARLRLEKAGTPVCNRAAWDGVKNQALQGFKAQAELAVPMPSVPAMRSVWTPLDAAIAKIVGQGQDADAALGEAQRRVRDTVKVSDRGESVDVVTKDAEKVYEQAKWQAEHPGELLKDSRWEASVLRYEPTLKPLLGRWCPEKHRGFPEQMGCPIPKALADLADQAETRPELPAVLWNQAKTEVTIALKTADGRVAMVRGGAPVTQNRAWQFVLGLLCLGLAVLAFVYRERIRPHLGAYAYVAPAIGGVLLLVFVPFGYGLSLAFYDVTPTREKFVGMTNFVDIILARGAGDAHSFYYTFGMTVLWTVVNVFLHVSIGLGMAMLLQDSKLRFRNVYRTLLIIPWAIPNYITALIWKAMFNAEYGFINRVFNLGSFSWFDHPVSSFFANLATNVWLGFPFMMVTALGALQSIPRELYEAADVDGAGRWNKFTNVTLPLLKPALIPAVILGAIWTFNLSFNVIYLVSGGAPDGATDILVTQAFRYAFEQYRYGYAAAYATIIFLILLTYTVLTNRITKATDGAFE